jgi:hypothetical protein
MATTFVNNLRLTEILSGTEEGNWGTLTNTNMQLLGEAFGYGEEAIVDGATATITIANGAADDARSLYLKITGSLTQICTITMGPNTSSRVMFIENGTSDGGGGPWDIVISQGSGSNVTIPNGEAKMVYMDGLGAGAAVVDAMAAIKVLSTRQPDHVYAATVTGLTASGGNVDIDWATFNAPTNPADGGNYLIIVETTTGAQASWTWPASFKWRNNSAPTLTTSTGGEKDVITLIYDATDSVYLGSYTLSHPA